MLGSSEAEPAGFLRGAPGLSPLRSRGSRWRDLGGGDDLLLRHRTP